MKVDDSIYMEDRVCNLLRVLIFNMNSVFEIMYFGYLKWCIVGIELLWWLFMKLCWMFYFIMIKDMMIWGLEKW